MEQLNNFEDNHSNYLFDHLTVPPYPGAGFEHPLQPTCVTTDPYTKSIYVVELVADCLRVSILSESGDIVNRFIQEDLGFPHGIAIYQDNLYMTLSRKPFLVNFKVADDLHLIRSKEDIGSSVDCKFQFDHHRRLAISNNGDVFVIDFEKKSYSNP